jgi:membrane protease YdiL (CAAX protease family)
MNAIIKHPALSFFTLTFLFSWSCFFSNSALLIYAGLYGPLIAAFIVVVIRDRRWHVEWLNLRIPPFVWIVLAVLIFPFIWALGNSAGAFADLVKMAPWQQSYWSNLHSVTVSSIIFTTFLGGGQEEFGWRGFALSELQKSFSPLLVSVILGIMHAMWHLPLYFNGWYQANPSVNDVFFIMGSRITYNIPTTVVMTFFFNRTHGNIWLMILLHVTYNLNPTPTSEFVIYALYAVAIILAVTDKMHKKLTSSIALEPNLP